MDSGRVSVHSHTSEVSENEWPLPPSPVDYVPNLNEITQYSYLDYEELEDIMNYCKGGFHPIHLGDVLNDRFEVVDKLGNGGFGIVWLCLDIKFRKWRAVKVMAADHSSQEGDRDTKIIQHLKSQASVEELRENGIIVPLEEFWIDGPNGSHHCHVMPLLSYSVESWRSQLHWTESPSGVQARAMCRQVIKSLSFLHSHGVGHGDFRPSNILMQVEGFEDLDKNEVDRILGPPELRMIPKGCPGSETWPDYYVIPISVYNPKWIEFATTKVAIIDYGESFLIDDSRDFCGIPKEYAAPELLFGGGPSVSSDIWALICTLYRIRVDRKLFEITGWDDEMCDIVAGWELLLGPLPEPHRTVWYQKKYGKYANEADETDDEEDGSPNNDESLQTEVKDGPVAYGSVEDIDRTREKMQSEGGFQTVFQATVGEERHIAQRKLDEEDYSYLNYRFDRQEIVDFADLLEQALKWEPTERIGLNEVLCHPWLKE